MLIVYFNKKNTILNPYFQIPPNKCEHLYGMSPGPLFPSQRWGHVPSFRIHNMLIVYFNKKNTILNPYFQIPPNKCEHLYGMSPGPLFPSQRWGHVPSLPLIVELFTLWSILVDIRLRIKSWFGYRSSVRPRKWFIKKYIFNSYSTDSNDTIQYFPLRKVADL